ncbi:unnamed protein product, partial [marine sediment metagenome]
MTFAEIEATIRAALPREKFKFTARGADLWVEEFRDEIFDVARAMAEALDHKAIDFRRESSGSIEYDDIDDIIED